MSTAEVITGVIAIIVAVVAWLWPRSPKPPKTEQRQPPPPPDSPPKPLAGRKLKVAIDSTGSYEEGGTAGDGSQFVVTVTNIGSAPVRVMTVGLELITSKFVAWPEGQSSSKLPFDLKPGDNIRVYFSHTKTVGALVSAKEYGLVVINGFARDEADEKTRSSPMSLSLPQ
jgi:hypothetical protein